MLNELQIDNVAVIEHADVRFSDGFNVLTGETGAGKSILIDSINAILGNRTTREIVRTGAERSVIYASFDEIPTRTRNRLSAMGIDSDGTLILSREITADGKSICRINSRPATAASVRDLVQDLVNIHGQLDNQELLDPTRHIDILDRFAGTDLTEYADVFNRLNLTVDEIQKLTRSDRDKAARMDLLRYQISEIDSASLKQGEEEELDNRKSLIQNSERIAKALQSTELCLIGDDAANNSGCLSALGDVIKVLEKVTACSSGCSNLIEKLNTAFYSLQDASADVASLMSELVFDKEDLDAVEERLDLIYRLKRKYGNDINEILAYRDEAAIELDSLEFSEERLQLLNEQFKSLKSQTLELASKLYEHRKSVFPVFEKAICDGLEFLNMPNVKFSVNRKKLGELTAKGFDDIEFYISANAGESLRPLSKIASGGEMARIMLAIKSVMADKDGVPTLIFDEIDTGVSGKSAQRIGEKLRDTSKHHQIICVTHSAQVAAYASSHLKIEKNVSDDRTYTTVTSLTREERVNELARIISGDNITPISLSNAEEILHLTEN